MKKQIPARTEQTTLNKLNEYAKKDNRSLSNLIDTILITYIVDREKNDMKK